MNIVLLIDYHLYCGRGGTLEGKYLCTQDTWDKLQSRRWYASDVLGKHSEVSDNFSSDSFKTRIITKEQAEFLCEILELNFSTLDIVWNDDEEMYPPVVEISGFNPFDYIREQTE